MKMKGISLIALVITVISVIVLAAIAFGIVGSTSYHTRQANYCPTCGRSY